MWVWVERPNSIFRPCVEGFGPSDAAPVVTGLDVVVKASGKITALYPRRRLGYSTGGSCEFPAPDVALLFDALLKQSGKCGAVIEMDNRSQNHRNQSERESTRLQEGVETKDVDDHLLSIYSCFETAGVLLALAGFWCAFVVPLVGANRCEVKQQWRFAASIMRVASVSAGPRLCATAGFLPHRLRQG